jgi:hypothetical protein
VSGGTARHQVAGALEAMERRVKQLQGIEVVDVRA